MKILVVDDEQAMPRLFKQRFRKELKSRKVEFHFAFSAEEALSYLEQDINEDPRLIFSDINMPGMDGLQLLQNIRKKFTKIQVFMITAYGDKQTKEQAMSFGAEGFFTKPLDFVKLKETIES